MDERIAIGYRRLIEVRLLHHYWLDEGSKVFDLISDSKTRERRLLNYDVRSFLSLAPTPATDKLIKGLNCIYRETALGFVVGAPDDLVVPLNAHFDFIVTVCNASFFNYTSLTLQPQKIYEVYYEPEDTIYRYKENVPVLSNRTGTSRNFGTDKILFLSTEYRTTTVSDRVEYLVRSGSALLQLTDDQASATQQLSTSINTMPIFVHQGDVHVIVPPAGLVGAPGRGVLLSNEIRDDVFAIIRLSAFGASDSDFDLTDNNGNMKATNPVFQIRFKNRSTFWSYLNKTTRLPITTELNPFPLTYFGNAGTKQKPTDGSIKIIQSGAQITKLVSEIYV